MGFPYYPFQSTHAFVGQKKSWLGQAKIRNFLRSSMWVGTLKKSWKQPHSLSDSVKNELCGTFYKFIGL